MILKKQKKNDFLLKKTVLNNGKHEFVVHVYHTCTDSYEYFFSLENRNRA